jgi:hypothetical protein
MGRWDGLDRRKFPRVKYPCLVIIRHGEGEADKEVILTHTENLGIGGVCVVLKQNVKMFCPVDIELDLLDLGNHIKCHGKVVWNVRRKVEDNRKPLFYDIGIEFVDLDKKEDARLEEIVAKFVKAGAEAPYTSFPQNS